MNHLNVFPHFQLPTSNISSFRLLSRSSSSLTLLYLPPSRPRSYGPDCAINSRGSKLHSTYQVAREPTDRCARNGTSFGFSLFLAIHSHTPSWHIHQLAYAHVPYAMHPCYHGRWPWPDCAPVRWEACDGRGRLSYTLQHSTPQHSIATLVHYVNIFTHERREEMTWEKKNKEWLG